MIAFFNFGLLLALGGLAVVGVLLLWDKPVIVIYLQIVYCCFVFFIISFLPLPKNITYLTDFFTALLLVQLVLRWKILRRQSNLRHPLLAGLLFFAVSAVSAVVNLLDGSFEPIFFLWGLRIYGRMYIFFIACTVFLQLSDIERLMKTLVALLPVNVVLCTAYKFVLGYERDRIGGMFGLNVGCDGLMCLYLMIVCAAGIIWYIQRKVKLVPAALIIAACLYIAAIAELKVLFIVLPVLVAMALFLNPSPRATNLAIVGIAMVIVAIPLFELFYPNFADFFSVESLLDYSYASSYGGTSTDLNRLSMGGYILDNILHSVPERLFGVSLGNADKFLTFRSGINQIYGHLRYEWFMYSFLLLECGLLGLTAYVSFFGAVTYDAWRLWRRLVPGRRTYFQIAALVATMGVALLVYNQVLHTEGGYFMFFVLAFPYVAENEYAEELSLTYDRHDQRNFRQQIAFRRRA